MDWSKKTLWELRNSIILNSRFTDDYENPYKIDPETVQEFFDGYFDYMYCLMCEDGFTDADTFPTIWDYDNPENLANYYLSLEDPYF